MPENSAYAPHLLHLPAVLQIADRAPFFGTITSVSEQGLVFDFQNTPPTLGAIGNKAVLNLEHMGQHLASPCLLIHLQGSRALLSLREATPDMLSVLLSINRNRRPHLAASLSILQKQHACHCQFMEGMKDVVDRFYLLLPGEIESRRMLVRSQTEHSTLGALLARLTQIRAKLTRQLTESFPMYPEKRAAYTEGEKANVSLELINLEQMDDWVHRTTIAKKVSDAITPLPHEFNHRYNLLLNGDLKQVVHPYHPESILNHFATLIAPLDFPANHRHICYELMGQALQEKGGALYESMTLALGDVTPETVRPPKTEPNLAAWLKASVEEPPSDAENPPSIPAEQRHELAAALGQLTQALDLHAAISLNDNTPHLHQAFAPIPGLLAHDRIVERFLPALPADMTNAASPNPAWASGGTFGTNLGGLTDLDNLAMEGLRTQLRQPPPIDSGPDRLPKTSLVRDLMQQGHGLVMEYTLNGLSYHAQPDHPAWTLINELDALHYGADDQGQPLNPTTFRAAVLAMQWLLAQEHADSALEQINNLLVQINKRFLADRQSRRKHYLNTLDKTADNNALSTSWCVIKQNEEAIPYEVLGEFDHQYALINRSATTLLEIPVARFIEDVDNGLIEATDSFDLPFLERSANATLTASLDAVHAFNWKDPASGCLKRSALIDELERRLEHPVIEPPTCCALIEIPTMRPGLLSLPGDELAVMQNRSGELLLEMLEEGEQCGRLSDVTFMLVFAPQDPKRVIDRLSRLKVSMEGLHPAWKMIGATVPLIVDGDLTPTPSNVLRRANEACANMREQNAFSLACTYKPLETVCPISPLPTSSLHLRCQKIESCISGAPFHFEVLLGLNDSLTSCHSTQSFVMMAEQNGLIHELDIWVLQSVFDWMNGNPATLDQLSGLSVNLSGACLTQKIHIDAMVDLLSAYPHLTKKLIIEVTETAAISNLEFAARSLRKLRKLGCRIALDDFGSGYSSYSYVRSLPLDYLKIDGTYIRNILTDKTDQMLTASMVDVAHALGLKVIAEYVDSEATYSWLKNLGVDYVQGYWVHEPERLDTLALH